MVQLKNSDNIRPESKSPCRNKLSVKLEIQEDSLDEAHGPLNKRSKISQPFHQQWGTETNAFSITPAQYNPLNEPSPLGLQLRKSPSLLDLIQMRLSQGNNGIFELGKKDIKGTSVSGTTDKLKASNFPASLLRIGTWERVSKYEGDLVAKCYFAKHKLVWEVLEGGLKNKLEIQWSDIMALKASCPDKGHGTLDIVLARQPLFFRETNPQPRKHTLWQATSDFTGGQASIHRRHFLQCPHGLLIKHFEKLIQCDPRLKLLSLQPEIVLDSPYFEPRVSVFEESAEPKCHGFDPSKNDNAPTLSNISDGPSQSAARSSSSKSELQDPISRAPEKPSQDTPSPSSVMGTTGAIEDNGSSEAVESKVLNHRDQFKVPELHASMSMIDLVSHIEHCISEQMTSGNPVFSTEGLRNKDKLEEIAQYLLSDSQCTAASDEQSLMSRVNSLCCLLQKDPATVQNLQFNRQSGFDGPDDVKDGQPNSITEPARENQFAIDFPVSEGESNVPSCKQAPAMSRKDSLGDLLLHLPRIASLPQFLFNIAEDVNNQAR